VPKVVVIMIGTNNTGHRKDPPKAIAATGKRWIALSERTVNLLLRMIFFPVWSLFLSSNMGQLAL